MIYNEEQVRESIRKGTENLDLDTDNTGQLMYYTGIYRWADGSYHDEADPSNDEEFADPSQFPSAKP